jgi:hypothetical protein
LPRPSPPSVLTLHVHRLKFPRVVNRRDSPVRTDEELRTDERLGLGKALMALSVHPLAPPTNGHKRLPRPSPPSVLSFHVHRLKFPRVVNRRDIFRRDIFRRDIFRRDIFQREEGQYEGHISEGGQNRDWRP